MELSFLEQHAFSSIRDDLFGTEKTNSFRMFQNMLMSDMEQWQLIPESECDDQDDYPDDAQIRRDIAGWEHEYAAWERNEIPLRTTIFTEDGQRLEPDMMTREQHDARLGELEAAKPTQTATEAYALWRKC